MGVINLGLLVDKIKRKLESSGFIKNTDYATASEAGVVKIGDNIDVTEAGVISVTFPAAGGFTVDEIWSGSVTNSATDISSAMTHPYTDYKMLYFMVGSPNAIAGSLIPVAGMVSGAAVNNNIAIGSTAVIVKLNEGFLISAASTVSGVKIYGLK